MADPQTAPANGKRMRLCVYCGRRTWHRLACEHHRDLLKNDPHYDQR